VVCRRQKLEKWDRALSGRCFVEHVNAVLRGGQDGAAPQGQVREGQVVVGDDDVRALQLVPGPEKAALADVRAAPAAALAVVGGDAVPDLLGNGLGPVVAVPVPLAAAQGIHHGGIHRQGLGGHRQADIVRVQGQQAVCPDLPTHDPADRHTWRRRQPGVKLRSGAVALNVGRSLLTNCSWRDGAVALPGLVGARATRMAATA
jgi:hypothetical protein